MRLEGDGGQGHPETEGLLSGSRQDRLMPDVDAVEIPEDQTGGQRRRGVGLKTEAELGKPAR